MTDKFLKMHKVKIYYIVDSKTNNNKPCNALRKKHYIHSVASNGLFAFVRDLSQAEIIANATVDIKINLEIRINYYPKLFERHFSDYWLEFGGKTYKLQSKPDEYSYLKQDMKLRVELVQNPPSCNGVEYE